VGHIRYPRARTRCSLGDEGSVISTVAGKPARGVRRRKYAPRLPPEERREQILDAALHLIAENGYGGASMEAVARGTGVAKPVVYDIFGGRAELLHALLEREERRALGQLAEVVPLLPTEDDPDQVLRETAGRFLDAVAESPDRWRLILLPVDGTPEMVREHVERGRSSLLEQVQALIVWGLDARGGPTSLDPELAARGLLALGEHAARLILTDPQEYPRARLVEFMGVLLAALERG
jgi:AcrR family transcriptional regulator